MGWAAGAWRRRTARRRALELLGSSAPAPSGSTPSTGSPVSRGRSSALHALGEAGLGRPRPDHEPGRVEPARSYRADAELGVVEGAEARRGDHDHRRRPGRRLQGGPEVEQRSAVGVEADRSPPAPSTSTVSWLLGQHADPVGVLRAGRMAHALPARSRLGRERLGERGQLLHRAAGQPCTSSASPGSARPRPVCTGFTTTTAPAAVAGRQCRGRHGLADPGVGAGDQRTGVGHCCSLATGRARRRALPSPVSVSRRAP